MRFYWPTLLSAGLLLGVASDGASFTVSNFEKPYSARMDPDDGSYYVSNVKESTGDKGHQGYVSKISSNGNIVFQKLIGGREEAPLLRSPRGLAVVSGRIFVADTDCVKVFSRKTLKCVKVIDFAGLGAKRLSNIASDGAGALYISDPLANTIFKVDCKKNFAATVFRQGSELGRPRGLLVNPRSRNLMVAGSESGQIMEIDDSGKVHVLRRGFPALEGIDYDNFGNLYVASSEKGEIYKISLLGRGTLEIYLQGLASPMDIAYDRKKDEIVIPSYQRNTVTTLPRERR